MKLLRGILNGTLIVFEQKSENLISGVTADFTLGHDLRTITWTEVPSVTARQ
jgi:hypothetical protein